MRAKRLAMREWPASDRCLALESCRRWCTEGANAAMAVKAVKLIQVVLTVEILVNEISQLYANKVTRR